MLKRKILTRMTRLGMAMYATFWCMSFTVCASDNPVSDLVMQDTAAILQSAQEHAGEGVSGEEAEGLPSEAVDEAVVSEAVIEEESGSAYEMKKEPVGVSDEIFQEELLGEDVNYDISEITLNVENLTMKIPATTYTFTASAVGSASTLDEQSISYILCTPEGTQTTVDNVTIDEHTGVLDFTNRVDEGVFYVRADYTNATGSTLQSNLCRVNVVVAPTEISLNVKQDGVEVEEDEIDVTKSGRFAFSVASETPSGVTLDNSRIFYSLHKNGAATDYVPTEGDGITFQSSAGEAMLEFNDVNETAKYNITVLYSNTLKYGDETIWTSDDAQDSFIFNLNPSESGYWSNVTRLSFDGCESDTFRITDMSDAPSFTAIGKDSEGSTADLDPEKITWILTEKNQNTAQEAVCGVKLDANGASAALDLTNAEKAGEFDVVVVYNNTATDSVNARLHVILDEATSESGTIEGISFDTPALTITNFTETYTVNVVPTGSTGCTLDSSKLSYTINGQESFAGVSLTKSGTGVIIDVSELKETTSFNITASYTPVEASTPLTTNCTCLAQLIVNELMFGVDIDGETAPDSQEITISEGGKKISFWVLSKDPSGVSINASRISWTLFHTEPLNFNSSAFPGESFVDSGDPAHAVVILDTPKKSDKILVSASYDNSFKNLEGENITMPAAQAHCMIHVEPEGSAHTVVKEVDFKAIPNGPEGAVVPVSSDRWNINDAAGTLEFDLYAKDPSGAELNVSRISWKLLENGKAVNATKRGIVFAHSDEAAFIAIESGKFNGTGVFNISAVYDNTYKDASGKTIKPGNAEASCIVNIDTRTVWDKVEAHLPEKTVDIQMYEASNKIPFVVRYKETDQGYLSYDVKGIQLKGATADDQEILQFFDKKLTSDKRNLNITLYDSVFESGNTVISKIEKKKSIKAEVLIEVQLGEDETKFIPAENLTIRIGTAKPTVKSTGIVTFNSYYAGSESYGLNLTGPYITGAQFIGAAPAGLDVFRSGEKVYLESGSGLPAKQGKKTLKLNVTIADDRYILPDDYSVAVPVTYIVKDGAPVVKPESTSLQLNPMTEDSQSVFINISDTDSATKLKYALMDSKNKVLSESNLTINLFDDVDPLNEYTFGSGYLRIGTNSKTLPGQTYKISVWPENKDSGRRGAAKTITVKTVDKKNMDKMGLKVKAKGAIDASKPGSALTFAITGKNVNLYGRTGTASIMLGDEPVTGNFTYAYNSKTGVMTIREKESVPFCLIENELAGKKVSVTVKYDIGGMELNTTISTKIGNSQITPKLGFTSAAINPQYNNSYEAFGIDVPITNLVPNTYDYSIGQTCGKANITLFEPTVYSDYDVDVLKIRIPIGSISEYIGKTISVVITPKLPTGMIGKLNAKSATFKITVQNPAKAKALVSAKVKGNIDAIRNDTYASAMLNFKNIYDPFQVLDDIDCDYIYQTVTVDKKKINMTCTDLFNCTFNHSTGAVEFRRAGGAANLPAGTYKAVITAKDYYGRFKFTTTVNIKVVRGSKTGVAINPNKLKLVNRDPSSYGLLNITVKDTRVNPISAVKVGSKFENAFGTEMIYSDPDSPLAVIFMKEGYVEKTRNKAITKAVTKTVPVEIYYVGSKVPDKVNVKVTINP